MILTTYKSDMCTRHDQEHGRMSDLAAKITQGP